VTEKQYEKWKEEHPDRRIFIYKRRVIDAFATPEELDAFFELMIKEVNNDGTNPKH